jgi:hypothetical protein
MEWGWDCTGESMAPTRSDLRIGVVCPGSGAELGVEPNAAAGG